ncbi:MAG: hypothetical protein ACK5JF_05855 [Oscillospiraceae bacterium]
MKKRFRITAFLVEVLIDILFFSIACGLLAGVFVKSYAIGKGTNEKNKAAAELRAISQEMKVNGSDAMLEEEQTEQNTWNLYYDDDWSRCPKERAAYYITLQWTPETKPNGTIQTMDGRAFKSGVGTVIFEMQTSYYIPQQGGAT